jgi:hypothetical protein
LLQTIIAGGILPFAGVSRNFGDGTTLDHDFYGDIQKDLAVALLFKFRR